MTKIGVLLCGHGSRSPSAVVEFTSMTKKIRGILADWNVEHGFLEFANPVLREGLDALRNRGCERILAVPGMLFAAMHAKNDIPSVLNAYATGHSIQIDYGRELGVDPKMLAAAEERVSDAMTIADSEMGSVSRTDTCLVVIGRGASDPDANGNVSKVARMLWEGMGMGWCETGFSGVTFPLVAPCLEHVAKLGYRRVVVFPYFLFSGILVDRIYGFTDHIAAKFPSMQFVKAGYLNDHPKVLETLAERATEILDGNTDMNCAMCKYRTQVVGFESEVGMPQESHHHHVEGQGASAPGSNVEDCELCDWFCTGACRIQNEGRDGHGHHSSEHHSHDGRGHSHHHPPYPHADHPLGPESVRKYLPE